MKRLLSLVFLLWSSVAFAQTPSPVTPGYQVCNNNSGTTQCGWIAIDSTHPLPVTSSGGGSQDVNISGIGTVAPITSVPGAIATADIGTDNLATAQVSITTSSTLAVAARTNRRSVTITNITGTQPIYCSSGSASTTGGLYVAGVAGASVTLAYSGTVNCIADTAAQTISVAEVY